MYLRGRDALTKRDINLGKAGSTSYHIPLLFAKCWPKEI
jgi:hypothetical protein